MAWQDGPRTIVHHAKWTMKPVMVACAHTDRTFAHDPYVVAHQVKSAMAIPILNKNKLKVWRITFDHV